MGERINPKGKKDCIEVKKATVEENSDEVKTKEMNEVFLPDIEYKDREPDDRFDFWIIGSH